MRRLLVLVLALALVMAPSDYFYDAVRWALSLGITNGCGPTSFCPNQTATRGMAVTFMHRSENLPAPGAGGPSGGGFSDIAGTYYEDAVEWAFLYRVTGGTTATTFGGNMPVTRGQFAAFLSRQNFLYRDLVGQPFPVDPW